MNREVFPHVIYLLRSLEDERGVASNSLLGCVTCCRLALQKLRVSKCSGKLSAAIYLTGARIPSRRTRLSRST